MPAPIIAPKTPKQAPSLTPPAEPYRSAVIDSREATFSTLSTFHQGSRVRGDYYSRVQGDDQAPATVDQFLPAVYGQLELTKGLEIRIEGGMTHRQGTAAHRGFDSEISAIFPGVTNPQEGELFILDWGDGTAVVATIIEQTDRGSPYAESATKVRMRITRTMTQEYKKVLDSKVVGTYVYDQKLLRNGLNPRLRDNEVDQVRRLRSAYARMANLYLRDFYTSEFKTLTLPMQPQPTYDPYLTKFVLAVFETELSPVVGMIKPLGVEHTVASNEFTLFDAIEKCDHALLYSVAKEAYVLNIQNFRTRALLRTIYYSGIQAVVGFIDSPYSNDSHGHVHMSMLMEIQKAGVRNTEFEAILPQLEPGTVEPRPTEETFIKRVRADNYYVFSEAFYRDGAGKSMLERLTLDMLKHNPIDKGELVQLSEYADKFNNLERFYYVPIIMALIKMAVGVAR